MSTTLKKVEKMLQEAEVRQTWGKIEIEIKAGKPALIRQTIQERADEELPNANVKR
jgi:hypothetical protein